MTTSGKPSGKKAYFYACLFIQNVQDSDVPATLQKQKQK